SAAAPTAPAAEEESNTQAETGQEPVLKRKSAAATTTARKTRRTTIRSVAKPAEFSAPGKQIFSFSWQKSSFPGTIIAGKFQTQSTKVSGAAVTAYFTAAHKQYAAAYAQTAANELEYFSGLYGPAPSPTLNVVELPDDTVPSTWAPELA